VGDELLDDVMKSTLGVEYLHANYNTDSKKSVTEEILQSLTPILEISIDEKIAFWQEVMAYGASRGIEFYFFTWNVFVWGADGKHGITNDQHNNITFDYYRKCIRELFITYPLLAGIGVTAGENMSGDREEWLHRVYAEGMNMAMEALPGRQIRLIHRTHQTGVAGIHEKFEDYSGPFDFSFKYAGAHIYGYDDPTVTDESFEALPFGKKAWVELHNHASLALEKLNLIAYQSEKEIRLTMGDIEAMALSGHYYAEKILGAVHLQFYRISGEQSHKEASIGHLVEAAHHWRNYADVAANQYEPQVLARNSRLDWIELMDDVLNDIEIARGNSKLISDAPDMSGVILEAEEANYLSAKERKDFPGYTGKAYLIFRISDVGVIEWTFDAPSAGTYTLAFRYATTKERSHMNLTLNGETQSPKLLFWNTGGDGIWMYTRRTVQLKAGHNSMVLHYGENAPQIDHLLIKSH
jgi:hypothetical protein